MWALDCSLCIRTTCPGRQAGKLFAVSRHWLALGGELLQVSKAPDGPASETQKVKDVVNGVQSKYVTDKVNLPSLQP